MRYRVLCFSLLTFFLAVVDGRFLAAEPAEDAPSVQTAPVIGQAGSASQSAGAQPIKDAKGTYTLQSATKLVVLDVVVKDAKGNVVTDLKREDFRVMEASQQQTILSFEPAGEHTIDPSITIHSTSELDKLAPDAPVNILLLDEIDTPFQEAAHGRHWLKEFLATQPDKLAVPTMLLAVSLQKFTVVNDYTQNKQTLLTALDRYFPSFPQNMAELGWKPDWAIPERTSQAVLTLLRVAEATAGHPGHKSMLWIGHGFPISGCHDDFAMPAKYNLTPIEKLMQQTAAVLRNVRVTLNTVDPGGISGFAPFTVGDCGQDHVFHQLARATGGDTMYGYNDVYEQIARGFRDAEGFYTLSYRPTTGSLDSQKFRKIVVTLNRPGLTATTSEGYYVQPASERDRQASFSVPITPKQLEKILGSALSSPMVYDAAPLTVTTSPSIPDSFVAKVDPLGLVWASETETERYEDVMLMASTYDRHGKELNRVEKSVRVSVLANAAGAEAERGLSVPIEIKRDPKAVRARFVVLVGQTGRMGSADVNLKF